MLVSRDVKHLVFLLVLAACRSEADMAGRSEVPDTQSPQEIRADPIPMRGTLDFDSSLLPTGARGKFSSFDGDSFAVTIPARADGSASPKSTFHEVVAPLMRAMGYGSRVGSIKIPSRGYVFQQTESGIPIETAVVIVTPTFVQGTLFAHYRVTNKNTLSAGAAVASLPRNLAPIVSATLVLLPHGSSTAGSIGLRYCYRILLADRADRARTWMSWIDAESGNILQLTPQFDDRY